MQVVQHNFVCDLTILPASLPAADSNTAGCSAVILVAVATENQQPVPWEAISSGLTLSLEVPDAAAADGAAAATGNASTAKGKAARGKASKRSEVLLLNPECLFTPQEEVEGLGPAAAEAAASAATGGCVVCFRTPQLTTAGSYTAAAEFRETRPELLPGFKKEVSKVLLLSHLLCQHCCHGMPTAMDTQISREVLVLLLHCNRVYVYFLWLANALAPMQ